MRRRVYRLEKLRLLRVGAVASLLVGGFFGEAVKIRLMRASDRWRG